MVRWQCRTHRGDLRARIPLALARSILSPFVTLNYSLAKSNPATPREEEELPLDTPPISPTHTPRIVEV
jgi:hypothetical protein